MARRGTKEWRMKISKGMKETWKRRKREMSISLPIWQTVWKAEEGKTDIVDISLGALELRLRLSGRRLKFDGIFDRIEILYEDVNIADFSGLEYGGTVWEVKEIRVNRDYTGSYNVQLIVNIS